MTLISLVVKMPSKIHDGLCSKIHEKLEKEGRIIMQNRSIEPDLVFISKDGRIIAVEIELTSSGMSDIRKKINLYSEYDEVRIFTLKRKKPYSYVFKAKRYLSKEIFERIGELNKGHQFGKKDRSVPKIAKQLEKEFGRKIPLSTIGMIRCGKRKWTDCRNSPEFEVCEVRICPK